MTPIEAQDDPALATEQSDLGGALIVRISQESHPWFWPRSMGKGKISEEAMDDKTKALALTEARLLRGERNFLVRSDGRCGSVGVPQRLELQSIV